MKILQVSTYDIRGGAARATYRLHCGLRNGGQDCRMLVKYRDTKDGFVSAIEDKGGQTDEQFLMEVPLQEHYINTHRTDVSNTMFSLPYPGYDISGLDLVQEADVINLHWVSQFQSPVTLNQLFALGKPVVWTLHDQWAFTGGCHYSAGCQEYRSNCGVCPQLANDPFFLPEATLKDKEQLFKNANLTIVTPSRWMSDCAAKSRLFKSFAVETIANSIETDLYYPLAKDRAKQHLGIPGDAVTFLFGAIDGKEKRKGFSELVGAMEFCRQSPLFRELLEKDRIRLLCFGSPNHQLESTNVPYVSLGRLETDAEIREAYSAADIFLLPSLEDNLPNTVLESMSCGTPVISFQIGGVPDMVTDGVTGYLVKAFDIGQMSEAIVSLALDPGKRESMGKAGRARVLKDYPLDVQAKRYVDLYDRLLREKRHSDSHPSVPSRSSGLFQKETNLSFETVPANFNMTLGSRFERIYDGILFQALKSFAPMAHKLWKSSELDRARRLEQVKKMSRLLESCEVDREARLQQINELTSMLESCEADRSDRWEQIQELTAQLEAENHQLLLRKHAEAVAKYEMRLSQYASQLKESRSLLMARESELKQRGSQLAALESELQMKESHLQMRISEIEKLKQELQNETLKAREAEDVCQALESTQVVRKARKLGLIRFRKNDIVKHPVVE